MLAVPLAVPSASPLPCRIVAQILALAHLAAVELERQVTAGHASRRRAHIAWDMNMYSAAVDSPIAAWCIARIADRLRTLEKRIHTYRAVMVAAVPALVAEFELAAEFELLTAIGVLAAFEVQAASGLVAAVFL